MSYRHKDTVEDSVIYYYDHVLLCNEYAESVLDELDEVYAQAAKADEYEAKAKLMDNIYAELKKRDGEAIDSLNVDYYDFGVYVARTIEEYESECDSNA